MCYPDSRYDISLAFLAGDTVLKNESYHKTNYYNWKELLPNPEMKAARQKRLMLRSASKGK